MTRTDSNFYVLTIINFFLKKNGNALWAQLILFYGNNQDFNTRNNQEIA